MTDPTSGPEIPADLRRAILDWHEAHANDCCGWSEGQECCIDAMLGSTSEDYRGEVWSPAAIAERQRRLREWAAESASLRSSEPDDTP